MTPGPPAHRVDRVGTTDPTPPVGGAPTGVVAGAGRDATGCLAPQGATASRQGGAAGPTGGLGPVATDQVAGAGQPAGAFGDLSPDAVPPPGSPACSTC